ncbi:hypothetical protein AURDEDRAFT_167657 [Auricularia subglabra TFB-10046 SS5]|nr:hypothetical protein AURDEDRAFT_167657 [Auricularia subglabra TFB-10046 SS5]
MRALTPTQGSRAPSVAGSIRDAASPTGSVRALSPSKWGSPRSATGSFFGPGTPRQDDYAPSRTEVALPSDMRSLEADLSLLPDVQWKDFPRWAQTSRNESYLRLIAANRDVEEKYQADVAAHRAEGKDIEELAIERHLKLTRNGEVEERRLIKDLQVRFLLQRKTEEYESWENDFKEHPPNFIVNVIQQIYVGHGN